MASNSSIKYNAYFYFDVDANRIAYILHSWLKKLNRYVTAKSMYFHVEKTYVSENKEDYGDQKYTMIVFTASKLLTKTELIYIIKKELPEIKNRSNKE